MTGPHIYGASNSNPYSQQQTPYMPAGSYYPSATQTSPFIPPADVSNYPPSPYRGPSPIPPPLDIFGSSASAVAFPSASAVAFPNAYDPTGVPNYASSSYQRPRALSYTGPPLSTSPYMGSVPSRPTTPSWPRPQRLSNPSYPGVLPGSGYSLSPWANLPIPLPGAYTEPTGAVAFHPFLDGESGRFILSFNLASPQFVPMQLHPNGTHVPVSQEYLAQHATHPPLYRMKIVCDELHNWPVSLEYDPDAFRQQTGGAMTYPPPITVGDVLAQIHRMLHERISHGDWTRLDERKRWKISQAYAARCASNPSLEHFLKNDGVKKVDYLLDKVWFRGLVRTSKGPEVLRLVVSRRAN